jgi:hypothetical protein
MEFTAKSYYDREAKNPGRSDSLRHLSSPVPDLHFKMRSGYRPFCVGESMRRNRSSPRRHQRKLRPLASRLVNERSL